MHSILFAGQNLIPSKIICIGRNYVEHIEELGNEVPEQMVVFNKPSSAISEYLNSEHGEPLHFETELCFLIKNGAFAGVGIGLDLTKRELQSKLKAKGLPWERAKAFDGAATFSEFIELNIPVDELTYSLHINDVPTQFGNTEKMIYQPEVVLKELQSFTHLNDGDIIMTGTPKGVGQVNKGAIYTARIFANENVLLEHSWQAI